MSENRKSNLSVPATLIAGALGVVIAVSGFGIYKMADAVTSIQSEVSTIRTEVAAIKETANNQPTGEDFQRAVVSSLENIASQKKSELMQAKYDEYENAPDKTPGDKSIYGNVEARFTLLEFSDTECPYCQRFHDTPKQIVDNSKGNVNWQWKHLPLGFHNPAAKQQAIAAECVREQKGNKAFWVFLDDVFKQTQLNGQGVSDMTGLLDGIGVDAKEVQECIQSGRFEDKVEADILQATNNGISGTPATVVVDNYTGRTQLMGGAQPPEAIMSMVRKMVELDREQQEDKAKEGSGGE